MMRPRDLLFVLLAGSGLAGCVRYQPQPLAPAGIAAEFEHRTLSDAGLRAFLEANLQRELAWPLPAWDATNLTLAAFYYHPDLDVARAKWETARAGIATAGERPNPTLSVIPAYDTTTSIPSPWLVTPTLDIPLETAGKRGHRLNQSRHLAEAARLNLAAAAWQVRSRVRRSLLDLFAARETARLLEEQQAIHAENLRLLETQLAAGAISAFELSQGRLASDAARFALHDAKRQEAEARVQLADAIGVPVASLESVQLSFEYLSQMPDETPAAEARRQALLNRPDILGALTEYAASESALQLEIAKQYPDVHLNPGYEFDQGDNKWALGFTVTLPVLNRNRGPIAEAQAKRAEVAAHFNALQARVIGEIDRACAAYRLARQKQAEATVLLGSLQNQEKTAQAMLDAGETSRSDLTALRLQLSTLALTRLDAVIKAQQAANQLEDVLQSSLRVPRSAWQNSPRMVPAPATKQRP